jgi:caa(3)-type oxidase subunit IV
MEPNHQEHHHHQILSVRTALLCGSSLLVLTMVTVAVAHIDLGHWNFFIAMAVATLKAFLVAFFFMGLKYDRPENAVIFLTSFIFLGIFMILTSTDLFFRGDVMVKGPLVMASSAKSKLKKPWISTPELVAQGKALFAVQCVSCHGAEGQGNGVAASALNPHPRNFTSTEGWKNGRKPTMVFKTLKEGLPPSAMASYATLPSDDRWALAHYVLSLGGPALADASTDFAKIGIDPNKEGGGATEAPTISIDLATERMTVPATNAEKTAELYHPGDLAEGNTASSEGKRLYEMSCVQCHGLKGAGGIKVRNLGERPIAFVTTAAFASSGEALRSQDSFNQLVLRGIPGELMPGFGQLSSSEMRELYQYVKSLSY